MRLSCPLIFSRCLCVLLVLVGMVGVFGFSHQAEGAACCLGGGGSSPLMTDLNQAELRISGSYSSVVAQSFGDEPLLFWDGQRSQTTWLWTPSLGYRFAEDWQVGGSFDHVAQSYVFEGGGQESSSRLGDTRLMLAYEWLHPSPSFKPWPQLFLSLEVLLPTGGGLEVGEGQGASRLGLHAFKRFGALRLSGDIRHSFFYPRSVGEIRLLTREQWNWSLGLLRSQAWSDWGYGLLLASTQRQGLRSESPLAGLRQGSDELFYEVTVYVIRSLGEQWTLNLSYSDQTILGPIKNTNLSRSLGLMLTHAWLQ